MKDCERNDCLQDKIMINDQDLPVQPTKERHKTKIKSRKQYKKKKE